MNNASSHKLTKNRIPGPRWQRGCGLWLRAGTAILGSVLRECFLGEVTFEQIPEVRKGFTGCVGKYNGSAV